MKFGNRRVFAPRQAPPKAFDGLCVGLCPLNRALSLSQPTRQLLIYPYLYTNSGVKRVFIRSSKKETGDSDR